jgi:hypothetical protein
VVGGGGVFHLVGHGRGRASAIELKELMRDYMSQSMDHGVRTTVIVIELEGEVGAIKEA